MYYIESGYTTIYNIILHSNKFKEIICLSAYIAEIRSKHKNQQKSETCSLCEFIRV